jgi:hypothetical protein
MSSPPTLVTSAGIAGAGTHAQIDPVSSDFAALASHMRQCSSAQGPWPAARSGLQRVHALVSGRIVTMACVAAVATISLFAFA